MGERRIGVAISDPDGRLAVPLRVLERRDEASDAQAIAELASTEGASTLVVGYPLSLDGSVGPQARRVEAFARLVADASGLPLELCDERLTSVQAQRMPAGARQSTRRRRAPSDDLAAAIILQSYLDRHRRDEEAAVGP